MMKRAIRTLWNPILDLCLHQVNEASSKSSVVTKI